MDVTDTEPVVVPDVLLSLAVECEEDFMVTTLECRPPLPSGDSGSVEGATVGSRISDTRSGSSALATSGTE